MQGSFRYLSGFDQLPALENGSEAIFREDNRMIYTTLTGHYIFNAQRFSLRSAFRMVDRQKRSAGSWILNMPANFQQFRTDSLLLPGDGQADVEIDLYQSFQIGLGGGYAYSLVKGPWTGTALVTGGVAFRRQQFRGPANNQFRNHFTVNPRIRLLAAVVFNQPRFFYGVVGRYLPGLETSQKLHTRIVDWQVRFMIGYRFYETYN